MDGAGVRRRALVQIDFTNGARGEHSAQLVLFDDLGAEPHFVAAAPIKPGKTLADARAAIACGQGDDLPSDVEYSR